MRYIQAGSILALTFGLAGVASAEQGHSTFPPVVPGDGTVIYDGVGVQNGPVFNICVGDAVTSPLNVNLLGNGMVNETIRQVEPGKCHYFQASGRVRLSWPEAADITEENPVRVDVITN